MIGRCYESPGRSYHHTNCVWYSQSSGGPIVFYYPPHAASVDHVEGFLEVNEIDVHWWLSFQGVLKYDVHWCWNLLGRPSMCCLLLLSVSLEVFKWIPFWVSSMPLQLWQSHKSPFLRSLTIHPLDLYNSVTVWIIYTEWWLFIFKLVACQEWNNLLWSC